MIYASFTSGSCISLYKAVLLFYSRELVSTMEAASLQETSVILEQEMKDDPDSPNLTEGGEEELASCS